MRATGAREVGFYGGVNYGFGYGGVGYEGGYWDHDRFNYNRSVNNVSGGNIHNVYNKTVSNTTLQPCQLQRRQRGNFCPPNPEPKSGHRTSNTGSRRHCKRSMCRRPEATMHFWRP